MRSLVQTLNQLVASNWLNSEKTEKIDAVASDFVTSHQSN